MGRQQLGMEPAAGGTTLRPTPRDGWSERAVMKMKHVRGGMVGGEGVFDVNLCWILKTKKSPGRLSSSSIFRPGTGCKGRKSREKTCACGGKRRHVSDFHRFPRRFYAASASEASWCLEIGLTLGSIQLTGSCPRSILADAQLRKELQIIWKRHMATSKAWAASEKTCIPFSPSC